MTTTARFPYDAFLVNEPDTDAEPPMLALTDRAGADRHLAAIARLEAEHELEKAGALAEVKRIQQWIGQRYETTVAQTGWHRQVLHRYHEAVLAVDPRLKTIKLPHGELQARAQQPSWEIDGPLFLKWAQENLPEAVRPAKPTEPTVDIAAAKRLLVVPDFDIGGESVPCTTDGELADGITVIRRDPKFSTVIGTDDPEVHDDSRARTAEAEALYAQGVVDEPDRYDYAADPEPF